MGRVILISGDNLELIKGEVRKCLKETDFYIKFPENNKHPKVWSRELRESIKAYVSCIDIIIGSFSEATPNLLGDMIYKKELDYDKVEMRIISEKFNITCTYDKEGYLNNYPIDYLGWYDDED